MLGFCRKNERDFDINSSNFALTRPSKASIKNIKVFKLLEYCIVATLISKMTNHPYQKALEICFSLHSSGVP